MARFNTAMEQIDLFKLISVIGTFLTGLCGLLMIAIKQKLNQSAFNVFISYSNAFGGGVMLCVGLVHMLNDANETLSELYDYPWAFLMSIVGYGIVFLLENVVLNKIIKRFRMLCQVSALERVAHQHGHTVIGHKATLTENLCKEYHHESPGHHHITGLAQYNQRHSDQSCRPLSQKGITDSATNVEKAPQSANNRNNSFEEVDATLQSERYTEKSVTLLAFCLLVAISFHSFFAGLSVGVMTDTSAVVATLIAIIAHKGVAAMVLGQAFLRSTLSPRVIILLLVLFAAMTPLDSPDRLQLSPSSKSGVLTRYAFWWFGVVLMAIAAIWS
eukprot:CFRG7571T1